MMLTYRILLLGGRIRMINLMIADDNIHYTEYLSSMLTKEKDIEVINISYDGFSVIDNYNNLKPDVLILDLDMPRLFWN